MSAAGVIPTPEERASPSLTDWHVTGEIRCPDCGMHFAVGCSLEDLQRFTAVHECPP
jgi:hypothetical protein